MADTNFHLLFRVGQIGHVQHGFGRYDNLGLLLALGLPNTLAKGQTMKVVATKFNCSPLISNIIPVRIG